MGGCGRVLVWWCLLLPPCQHQGGDAGTGGWGPIAWSAFFCLEQIPNCLSAFPGFLLFGPLAALLMQEKLEK